MLALPDVQCIGKLCLYTVGSINSPAPVDVYAAQRDQVKSKWAKKQGLGGTDLSHDLSGLVFFSIIVKCSFFHIYIKSTLNSYYWYNVDNLVDL